MSLGGQYGRTSSGQIVAAGVRGRSDHGFAMAALLVGIAVMTVMLTAAMPVWRQINQREKEAELIFRAGQYTRAIALFQRKYANAFPPNVDMLIEQRYLRKKYKDPITGADFRLLSPLELQAIPGGASRPGVGGPGRSGPGRSGPGGPGSGGPGSGGPGSGATSGAPGMSGAAGAEVPTPRLPGRDPSVTRDGAPAQIAAVVSRSSAKSIRIYKTRQQYNQWIVTAEDVFLRGSQAGQQVDPLQPNRSGQPSMPGTNPGGTPGGTPGGARPGSTFPTTPPPSRIR